MQDNDQYKIMSLAEQLCGSKEKARYWYQHELISSFNGLTPQQMVTAGRGASLLRYLRSLQAGVVG